MGRGFKLSDDVIWVGPRLVFWLHLSYPSYDTIITYPNHPIDLLQGLYFPFSIGKPIALFTHTTEYSTVLGVLSDRSYSLD